MLIKQLETGKKVRVNGLLVMASIEILITVTNIIHPIVARVYEIIPKDPNTEIEDVELYEQIIMFIYTPLSMIYEATCFCYLVYKISHGSKRNSFRLKNNNKKNDTSFISAIEK